MDVIPEVADLNGTSPKAVEYDLPTVDDVKWAIMAYGPVAACLYVDEAFAFYVAGVLGACFLAACLAHGARR